MSHFRRRKFHRNEKRERLREIQLAESFGGSDRFDPSRVEQLRCMDCGWDRETLRALGRTVCCEVSRRG